MDIQKIISPRTTVLLVTLGVTILIVAATAAPAGTEEKIYIPVKHTADSITVKPGTKITQRIIALPETYSGVVLYTDANTFWGRGLDVAVQDQSGQIASGRSVKTTFLPTDEETMRLEIPTNRFTVTEPTHLFVYIATTDQQDLSLKTSSDDQKLYASGELTINETKTSRDLALSLTKPAPLPFGIRQGMLAGAAFLLGLALISCIPRNKYRWAGTAILIAVITPLALAGYWFSSAPLGISDWDYYFSLHHVYRQIILEHGQFPFWNPYTCGGTAGLADPEFPLFTPTFLLELIFGIPTGLRLAIFLSTAVGALGMLALAKRLGLSPPAALLASLAAFFGSVNLLEITEGHVNVFAAAWIPWIFWSWLGAYRTKRYRYKATGGATGGPRSRNTKHESATVTADLGGHPARQDPSLLKKSPSGLLCGVFLALTFFQGGIYLLMYTVLAFILLPFLVSRPRDAIIVTFKAGLWALGLAAVKLLPALSWLSQFQDKAYASSATTLPYLYEILLGRHLHGADILPGQGTGWHEYGAYLGPLVAALSILGLTTLRRSRLVRALAISAALAILLSSAGPLLKPAFDQLPFLPRSSISRFILFAVIPLSLLAGIGLDTIAGAEEINFCRVGVGGKRAKRAGDKRGKNSIPRRLLLTVLPGLVAVDLMSLSYPLSKQAFVVSQTDVQITSAPQPIAFTTNTYMTRLDSIDYTRSYLATLAGYGTLNYCTPLSPEPSVVTVDSQYDSSYLTTTTASYGTAELVSFSPNRILARATINQATDVVINTNYAKGWYVNNQPAHEITGRVGIPLTPGTYNLAFRYRAPGLVFGSSLTLVTLMAAALLALRNFKVR